MLEQYYGMRHAGFLACGHAKKLCFFTRHYNRVTCALDNSRLG